MNKQDVNVVFISKILKNVEQYITDKLQQFPQVELIFSDVASEEELINIIPKADIVVGWRPPKKLLLNASRMKLFINPGAGIHHLISMFQELNETREILLANGHGNSYFVAQHAVGLLLTLTNKIIQHHQWMCSGKWRTGDDDAISIPMRFKRIGLLGYGTINQKVHRFMSGFDVKFSILRKHWNKQKNQLITPVKKYESHQLHEFLSEIDVLIIAVPVTSTTKGMINLEELKLLGHNGLVVNVARGDIIDEKSLFVALRDKVIAGAAIDVWYIYNPQSDEEGKMYPYNFPFHTIDNIVLSPHRGYSPFNDLLRWDEVIENITRMAKGRNDFINVVDLNDEY
jgi:phosphoglycerate dehydrogenase-like enzyme